MSAVSKTLIPGVEGDVHDRLAGHLVGMPAEVHGAESERLTVAPVRPRWAYCIASLLKS
jgi:hypothetical protein